MKRKGALKVLLASAILTIVMFGSADARKLDLEDPYLEPHGIQLFFSETGLEFIEDMLRDEFFLVCNDATFIGPEQSPSPPEGYWEGSNPNACFDGSCLRTTLAGGLMTILSPGQGAWHNPDVDDCLEIPVIGCVICFQLSVQDDVACNDGVWYGEPAVSNYNGQPCRDCEIVYYGDDPINAPDDVYVNVDAINWMDGPYRRDGLAVEIDFDNCAARGDGVNGPLHVCTGNPPPGDSSSYPCASAPMGSAACYNDKAVRIGAFRVKLWEQVTFTIFGLDWHLCDDALDLFIDDCPGYFAGSPPSADGAKTYCLDTYANVSWLDIDALITIATGDNPWTLDTMETGLTEWRHLLNVDAIATVDISGPDPPPDHILYIKIIGPCPILGSGGYSWLNYDPCTELINPIILNLVEGVINGALNNTISNAIVDALSNMFPMDIAGLLAAQMGGKECPVCNEDPADCTNVPYGHCDVDGKECYTRQDIDHLDSYWACVEDDILGEGYAEFNIGKTAFQWGFYPELIADWNDNGAFQLNLDTGLRAKTTQEAADADWWRCNDDSAPNDGRPDRGSLLGKWDSTIGHCVYYSNLGEFAPPETESRSCVFAGNVGAINEIDAMTDPSVQFYPYYDGAIPTSADFRGQDDGLGFHSMGDWEGESYMMALSISQNIINRIVHGIIIGGALCITLAEIDPETGEEHALKDFLTVDLWSKLVPILQQVARPNSYVQINVVPRGDSSGSTQTRLRDNDPRADFLGDAPLYDDRTPKVFLGSPLNPGDIYREMDWPSQQLYTETAPVDGYYDLSVFFPSIDIDLLAQMRDGGKWARVFTLETDILAGIDVEMDLGDFDSDPSLNNENDNVFYITMDIDPIINNVLNISEACGTSHPNPCGDLIPSMGLSLGQLQGAIGGLLPTIIDAELALDIRVRGHTESAPGICQTPWGTPSDAVCNSPFMLLGMGFDILAMRPDESSYRVASDCPYCPSSDLNCDVCGVGGNDQAWTSVGCSSCVDLDGDGRGVNCDFGPDCDDGNGGVWVECDAGCSDDDNDGHEGYSATSCIDGDGDGRGLGCDQGSDCDDSNGAVSFGCGACVDADGDEHDDYDGSTCPTGDDMCDDTLGNHDTNWSTSGCANCIDNDGDGRGAYCDAGTDCNDNDNTVWQGCSQCVDADGDGHDANTAYCTTGDDQCDNSMGTNEINWTAQGCSNCVDNDNDGYGANCDLGGTDCDDTDDSIHYGCISGCIDLDNDGHDGYNAVSCATGDDSCDWVPAIGHSAHNWTATGCGSCVDGDGDHRGVSCDQGPDCDDADNTVYIGCGVSCVDSDGDQHAAVGASCPTGDDQCDDSTGSHEFNWSVLGCGSCVDADGDGRGANCDNGPDCDDTNNAIAIGCAINCVDADGDTHPAVSGTCPSGDDNCDGDIHNWTVLGCGSCADGDGDGRGTNCDKGLDCNDSNAGVVIGCNLTCSDVDADDHDDNNGSNCPNGDDMCANSTNRNEVNWSIGPCYTAASPARCIDNDGDKRGDNCNWGADCNDTNSGIVNGCILACVDADGDRHDAYNASSCPTGDDYCDSTAVTRYTYNWSVNGCNNCVDADGDWRGTNCDWGPDGNDGNASVIEAPPDGEICSDLDGDGRNGYNTLGDNACLSGTDRCDGKACCWSTACCNAWLLVGGPDGDKDCRFNDGNADAGTDCADGDAGVFQLCKGTCTDADGDSHSAYNATNCPGGDDYCDANPKCWSSNCCNNCVDTDGDNRGPNCDWGADCNTSNGSVWIGCTRTCSDADNDGHDAYHATNCPTGDDMCDNFTGTNEINWTTNGCNNCVDGDSDERGANCDKGPDCKDDDNACVWGTCCGSACVDVDLDGHEAYDAVNCTSGDDMCDNTTGSNEHNWTNNGCNNCVDSDNDGKGTNCDKGVDCDDTDSACVWGGCCPGAGGCVDADGDQREEDSGACARGDDQCDGDIYNWTTNGCNNCVDVDGDHRGANCDYGTDCDDGNNALWSGSGCGANCTDADGDDHAAVDVACPSGDDYCDGDADNFTNAACSSCVDGDGDGRGANCDQGPDCDDADGTCTHGACCPVSCVDIDSDGHDAYDSALCPTGDDNCDAAGFPFADNWTTAGCSTGTCADGDDYCDDNDLAWSVAACGGGCVDGDGDGYGLGCDLGADCDDADIFVHGTCPGCEDSDGDGHGKYHSLQCPTGDDVCDGANTWFPETTHAPHGTYYSIYMSMFGGMSLGELLGPLLGGIPMAPKKAATRPETSLILPTALSKNGLEAQTVKSLKFSAAEAKDIGFTYDNTTISWTGSDDYTSENDIIYTYRVDYGAWHAFTRDTKVTLYGLLEGKHIFEVISRNSRGVHDETPAKLEFYIDSIGPEVYLQGDVAEVLNYDSPSFYVDYYDFQTPSDQVVSTWRVDESPWADYDNYKDIQLDSIGMGDHTLYIKAMDTAGNESTFAHEFRVASTAGGAAYGCAGTPGKSANAGLILLLLTLFVPVLRRARAKK
jgi:hypothetical protein